MMASKTSGDGLFHVGVFVKAKADSHSKGLKQVQFGRVARLQRRGGVMAGTGLSGGFDIRITLRTTQGPLVM